MLKDTTIVITNHETIKIERLGRDYAWVNTKYRINRLTKSSVRRLIAVLKATKWEHHESQSGGYESGYGYDFDEYDIFEYAPDTTDKQFLARLLKSLA